MEVGSLLLRAMDEAFDAAAWHGPNLLGSVRGLSVEEALWRPGAGLHNVWEIVLHCAYWKHRVHARVQAASVGATRVGAGGFPRPGRNWPKLPAELSAAAWRADVALLRDTHAALRAVAASLPAAELDRPGPGQKKTRLENLLGIAHHDVYHAGQIRLLRRLSESAGTAASAG